jgi:hypothetical protein
LIEKAQGETEAKEAVLAALDGELGLDEYAGVDDTFSTVSEDCQPITATSGSNCCDLDGIYVGDEMEFYAEGDSTLIAPDESYAVAVGHFADSDPAACLEKVNEAMEAIGTVSP